MIQDICGNCSLYKDSVLYYDRTKSGKNPKKEFEAEMKQTVDTDVHLYFPVSGLKEVTVFQSIHQFIQIVESPGSAFIVVDQSKKPKTTQMINQLLATWPLTVMIVLLMVLTGVVIWVAVSIVNFEAQYMIIKYTYHLQFDWRSEG